MPATGKVNLLLQTIYCFIPILDLYAAYQVKKLRWYIVIILASAIVVSIIMSLVTPPIDEYDPDKLLTEDGQLNWEYAMFGENRELGIANYLITEGILIAIAVYVIRRWSKQWNMQFNDIS